MGVMAVKERVFTCSVGDIIRFGNSKMLVSEIIEKGREATRTHPGERAAVAACRIMSNGQVLRRSPMFVEDWSHN